MLKERIKLAVIGCGAVAEHRHLPALARRSDCCVTALVDSHPARAERLAARFAVPHVVVDYRELLGLDVDAAVVAVPNYLHAPVSIALLTAGIHVLVEKPMALAVSECDAMIQAATAGDAILAVGLMRRFMHAAQLAKCAVDGGLLGPIQSFDIRDGVVFDWPLASDFPFRKASAGGGVLIDTGVHTLDQVLWWLGDVASFEYYDDNLGGVETECVLHLTLRCGATGIVELSRLRNLRGTAIIRGERAELEVGLVRNSVALRIPNAPVQISGQGEPREDTASSQQGQIDIIAAEYDDFLEAVRLRRPPAVSGAEGRRSMALIEACYQRRQPLCFPWSLPFGGSDQGEVAWC